MRAKAEQRRPIEGARALPLAGVLLLACAAGLWGGARGGDAGRGGGASGAAEQEIERRMALVARSEEANGRAIVARGEGRLEEALAAYREAHDLLPQARATEGLRKRAAEGHAAMAIALARAWGEEGRFREASEVLDAAEEILPGDGGLKGMRGELGDPARFPPAMTPEHLERVSAVERHLRDGRDLMQMGLYDQAEVSYEQVLRLDPYNSTARRGMTEVSRRKSGYFEPARNEMRAARLAEVEAMWEREVPAVIVPGEIGGPRGAVSDGGRASITAKLERLVLEEVDLVDASLQEALEFLTLKARELDGQTGGGGVNFVLNPGVELEDQRLNVRLSGVPLGEVLRYMIQPLGLRYRIDSFAVTILDAGGREDELVTRSFRVPPGFFENKAMEGGGGGGDPFDPFGRPEGGGGGLQLTRMGPVEALTALGIQFPDGSSASYNPGAGVLVVRNTTQQLDFVEGLVEQAFNTTPRQVRVQLTMVQVTETTLNELGFDWLLSSFGVVGDIYGAGGTPGNGLPIDGTRSRFPISGLGGIPVGQNPLTSGLRSVGGLVGGRQTIDQLIAQTEPLSAGAVSPSALAVTGVFTDPQFQGVMRALSQNKGVDLAVSPATVTKSGQRARVEVVREFPYPVEFESPQIPQNVGFNNFDNPFGGGNPFDEQEVVGGNSFPIVPTTPTAFDVRKVGVILEVEPVIGDDNFTVDLNLSPEIVLFEGFIDYGSDINLGGSASTAQIQPNDILQPVFRTNRLVTSIPIWDGATVVVGGSLGQSVDSIRDRVPGFGDLPFVGRLFQSRLDSKQRLYVIFFVTVDVIDPGGQRVNVGQ